ncbi:UDP-2,3-diacylglucosamine diphosphatase [Alteromonas oceanisediminis]|uniref:UDP-2,3-diacylglucosamine diphosphatase n=1 Tax=Alteromonas oceanisediminis TaxID=2836180 RepID=UPI001BDA0A70|nr:UDP-2,3-diacylglucosamine diphosphatase [Alteromonas oceanisediminis]MBT0587402.1 UDP-2,3-diacylglucosamine diphosphatase [Alteromonas oceanisediminis]
MPPVPVTYIISDLHLGEDFPEITQCFATFMRDTAPQADALYVLGDLFEVWFGDDNVTEFNTYIAQLFQQLSASVPVYFIHGNRDFAVGETYARKAGFTILDEQTVVDFYGTQAVLLHGDELCTADVEYQKFRQRARTRWWKTVMGALPLSFRRYLAQRGRKRSKENKKHLAADIMDVTPSEVVKTLEKHNVQVMIHGHTHRPNVHSLTANGEPATRIVLGDWYDHGSVLAITPNAMTLETRSFKRKPVP